MKRCTERPASGSQVANRTGSLELWNKPEVFTETNTSDSKTGEGTGDASPKAIKPIITPHFIAILGGVSKNAFFQTA